MDKYYVNAIYDRDLTQHVGHGYFLIGLFKQCHTDGRGNFCGYYATEYYVNTELYAYYVTDNVGIYKPESRSSEVSVLERPAKYKEIKIGSHMWTYVIEAESVSEAIALFADAKWRRWRTSEDEIHL